MAMFGVLSIPNIAKTGKMNGFSFSIDGVNVKGSKCGGSWSVLRDYVSIPETATEIEELRAISKMAKNGARVDDILRYVSSFSEPEPEPAQKKKKKKKKYRSVFEYIWEESRERDRQEREAYTEFPSSWER
jgi:hypothetical protein